MYRFSTVIFSILVFFTVSYAQLEQAIVRNDQAVIFYNPSDTFYGFIWIQNNDEGYGGYVNATQPQYTTLTLHPLLTCPYPCWVFITPRAEAPGYTGFDSFTYNYTYLGINSPTGTVDYIFLNSDGAEKAGNTCPTSEDGAKPIGVEVSKGAPVNVSNGNMWLSHMDYSLANPGEDLEVDRFYNSVIQTSGIFGYGWTTKFDERLVFINSQIVRWNRSDGKAIYFARKTVNDPYRAFSKVSENLIPNQDGTFSVKNQLGFERKFNSTGKLIQFSDRNGNVTSLTYNQSGFLIEATDTFNRKLFFSPNANGTISQISDAIGTIAQYEYETNSTILKSVTYPDGSKYSYTYQTIGNKIVLTTVKDALQNILEFHEYDTSARAITSERQNGVEKYTLAYQNDFTTVTDALGNETKYYFTRGFGYDRPIGKIEGLGCCGAGGSTNTVFAFDSDLNIKSKTDALGRTTTSKFDSNRNKLEETDSFGTQKWTYNSFGQVLTYQDRVDSAAQPAPVYTLVNTYDSAGNLRTSTNSLGHVTTVNYPTTNNKGLPDSIQDARNNVTKFKWYPTSGLLQEIEDATGKKTTFTYDARGRTRSTTSSLTETTLIDYFDSYVDTVDGLTYSRIEVTYPNSEKVTYRFDRRRLMDRVTDDRGKLTKYEYDSVYRLKKIIDPLSHFKEFDYDLMSNLKWFKDALGNQTDFKYDDFNRLKEIEYPAPTSGGTRLTEKYKYDLLGRVEKVTDTAGRDTIYTYNTALRENTITNPLLETTKIKYNQRFLTTEVQDARPSPNTQAYTFGYDEIGRLISETRAGTSMTYEYDQVNNLKKRTDHSGRISNYTYDNLNRLTKIEYDGGANNPLPKLQSTYGYDDLSRLISATNESGTVTFGYDNRGRLDETTDVFNQAITYQYERSATVNQKRMILNGTLYASYNYDDDNRLSNIVNAADSTTIGYTYYADDTPLTRTYPNGVSTTYLFDNMRRLKRLTDSGPSGTLFDREYAYNSANQISQITEPSSTRLFGYDNADRLTSVTGSATENYVYDKVGNRESSHLSSSYVNALFNRVTSTQTATYNYDTNGNTTLKSEGKEFWRYSWDNENKLTTASTRKSSVRYKYDALGRRVQRIVGNSKENTKYTYEGDDVLLDNDDGTITKYLNGPGIDNKLRATNVSSTNYFLSDHLGSTNGLTNSSGSLTASNSYDSFGNPANSSFPSRYQFTGREYDSSTGLQYSRARFYDPKLGRFISEDPIGFAGGDVNLYGYVWNNPFNFTDPFGLDARWDEQVWRAQQDLIEALEGPIAAVVGFGDGAGFGLPRMIRDWQGNDNVNWDCYSSYTGGSYAGIAASLVVPVGVAARVTGLGGKLAIHGSHHTFGRFGNLAHIQINFWRARAKGSGGAFRVPLPSRKNFKEIRIWPRPR